MRLIKSYPLDMAKKSLEIEERCSGPLSRYLSPILTFLLQGRRLPLFMNIRAGY